MNFILSCASVLQKYDAERDEAQRKWQAAMWGVELKDSSSQLTSNSRKQVMTQADLMRNYHK